MKKMIGYCGYRCDLCAARSDVARRTTSVGLIAPVISLALPGLFRVLSAPLIRMSFSLVPRDAPSGDYPFSC